MQRRYKKLRLPYLPPGRILRGLLGLVLLGWAAGCADMGRQIVRGASPPATELLVLPPPQPESEQLPTKKPPGQPKAELLPPAKEWRPSAPEWFSTKNSAHKPRPVPINLDTVFRLAESQNGQTAIARHKLDEAFAGQDLASKAWIPDLWVGTNWWRHDGGITNPVDGSLARANFNAMFAGLELHSELDLKEVTYQKVDAERRVWQQKAELSKLNSQALTEASTAYVDLLAARAAEAAMLEVEELQQDLLKRTLPLAKELKTAEVDVARIQAELDGQQQLIRKMRESSVAAAAKLIYQLGLDPGCDLVPMDRYLAIINLVNVDVPLEELVAQAMQHGPGVHELEGLLNLIHQAEEKAAGLSRFLPVFDVCVGEGGYGSGPGDNMAWDNRMDLAIQVRWNLTELCTAREKQRVTQAKIGQVHATYQDLRAKLAMGVQEAREAVISGREQIALARKQVEHATEAYEKSKFHFINPPEPQRRSPSEVLLAVRSVNAAHINFLMATRDHDKAQLRLAILTGLVGRDCEH